MKRVQTPSIGKMLPREHKVYMTENMMVKSMKEMNKYKSIYTAENLTISDMP